MANIFPYALYSGDPIPVTLIFYDLVKDPSGNTVLDLTGSYVGLTVKVNETDADVNALYQEDMVGDMTGQVAFSIPGQAVGTFFLDVKWWDKTGTRNNILAQQFTINQSTTLRTAPVPS
jgi:hypothetical protein